MRIAIVCYPTFGGSGVVATMLGTNLADRGHEVHFVTYRQPVKLELLQPNIYFHEVSVEEYPLFHYQPYDLALSSKLVKVVRQYKIDILHVHYAIPHAYAGYMAQQMVKEEGIHLPMVTTLHGTDITLVGQHPVYKPSVAFSINNSDLVTSVSASLKQDTLDNFAIKREIEVIPNFIDIAHYQKEFDECDRSNMAFENERIITHVSNMRPVKRIKDIIKVFAGIDKKVPSVLIMVGDGPDRITAERLAVELDIRHKVKFLGNSSETDKILCFTDLFLLTSQKESFGLAALEAMANKTPVISTNSGGLPEVNQDGFSGFTSDVGDVEKMIRDGIHILKDDETLETFKNNAFAKAKEFDADKIIPLYEKAYKSIYSQ